MANREKYSDPRKIKSRFVRSLLHVTGWSVYHLAKQVRVSWPSLKGTLDHNNGLRVDVLERLLAVGRVHGIGMGWGKDEELFPEMEVEIRLAKERDGRIIDTTKLINPSWFVDWTAGVGRSLASTVRLIRHRATELDLPEFLKRIGCSESALYRCERGETYLPWPCLWKLREIASAHESLAQAVATLDLVAWHCLCFPDRKKEMLHHEPQRD